MIQIFFLVSTILINYMNSETLAKSTFQFINLYEAKINGVLSIKAFIPYIILFLFLLADFVTILIYSKKQKNVLLLILFIAIYGLQYSMILAPYTPNRTCLTSVIFLIFAIIYLINYLIKEKIELYDITLIILMYINISLAFILYISNHLILKNKYSQKILLLTALIPLVYIALINYKDTLVNYYLNKRIYNENVNILKNYDGNEKTIYLKKFQNETYGYATFLDKDWIELEIRVYYNIPQNVELEYMEEK